MKAESTIRPQQPFKIEYDGDKARVIFYENIKEVNVVSEGGEEGVKYEYDTYSIDVRNRSNLEESVATDLEEWKQAAKEKDNEAPPETDKEKMLRLEKENKMLEGTIMELTAIMAVMAAGGE